MTHGSGASRRPATLRRAALAVGTTWAAVSAVPAHAFLLEGEALDTAASVIALIVIFVVPIVLIVAFWIVHVLPEKIAHKRQHPQTDAIKVLCLLSLVFGGLLWPLAWIWAYSKPVLHQLAYGTDKLEHKTTPSLPAEIARPAAPERTGAAPAASPSGLASEITHLRTSIDRMLANGGAPKELAVIRDQLAALEPPSPKAKVEELH